MTAGSVVEIQWSPQSLFGVIVSSAMVPSHVVRQLSLVDFSGTAWPVQWLKSAESVGEDCPCRGTATC